MFCYQCQETAGNKGCGANRGVCGKTAETSDLMDELVLELKHLSMTAETKFAKGAFDKELGDFICEALFATITNANFDSKRIQEYIVEAKKRSEEFSGVVYTTSEKSGVLATENEDVRSLRELITYGIKGIAAYAHHAANLGFVDNEIYRFMVKALASTLKDLSVDELVALTLATGECSVTTMAILDKANTETYGNTEITKVNIGVGKNPGILISGHDLQDMEDLLEQTKDSGVDIYTHSEMLPAHYYPAFKKYKHLVGNYGNAWWQQDKEFETFNGPVIFTSNCITPLKDSYKDRIYTTNAAGYPGAKHIPQRADERSKDFSEIIAHAKKCKAPVEIEKGEVVGGFGHNQVIALADKVVAAVKSGAIKRFIVMGGCDGRQKGRSYFTEVAEELPKDTIILTAGCAKFRYNKLELGDIGGIPRVLDAGQCNDCYSLAVIALKLKEVFELDDINKLPISFDIAWYEQKAVTVLLALLHLGVKGIRLGPTIPAFLSPNVLNVLVNAFDIKPIDNAKNDIKAMMAGK
ncbi:MAG: hydroxylamine reductase [bacterium]|nr:hydroxylamine reductase [bacterium]